MAKTKFEKLVDRFHWASIALITAEMAENGAIQVTGRVTIKNGKNKSQFITFDSKPSKKELNDIVKIFKDTRKELLSHDPATNR